MEFIVGGAYQGKTEYVKEQYGFADGDISDGKTMDDTGHANLKCIVNFHELIKKLWQEGKDPAEAAQNILDENPNIIIIMDEVGNGIVPVDRGERL